MADLEKVICAFISSRLDYCNAFYSDISKRNLQRLQLIQNAAARLLTRTKKRDQITQIFAPLHWLPVSFRIYFKILLLVFKALKGQAPVYICDLMVPISRLYYILLSLFLRLRLYGFFLILMVFSVFCYCTDLFIVKHIVTLF